ncbi:uncharacterized protein [Palaemon carinicauda]|uniref:uncharacterized protein n=1 Tax=Palaemon carinicauda TaxID=392227 RepID=UPI0035B60D33
MCEYSGNMMYNVLPLVILLLISGTDVLSLSLRESRGGGGGGGGGGGIIGSGGRVISSHIPGIGRSSSYAPNKVTNVKGMATDLGDKHLQLYGVEVPVYKFRGEDAQLECKFDRGNDPLYSVKWYKDDDEFYSRSTSSVNWCNGFFFFFFVFFFFFLFVFFFFFLFVFFVFFFY